MVKRVTWLELFFDLVFVFAVTATARTLQQNHSWLGLAEALAVFVPLFWVWVGTTMHANLHDVDTVRGRLGVFTVALCSLVLSLALPGAFGESALVFGGAYWAARLVLVLAVHGQPHRRAFTTFTVGALITGPLFVVGALLPPGARLAVWAVAAVIDLSVPFIVRTRLRAVPFEASHLAERFGLLVIIALGETVVAMGEAASEHLDPLRVAALTAAFAVCCGLWWVYFEFAAPAIHSALESAEARIEIIRPVLSYAHLSFIAGIIGVAAGIGASIEDPWAPLHLDLSALLFGGTALYLGTFGFTRWRMFHSVSTLRLSAAALGVALIWVAPAMPALAAVSLLAVLLVVLNGMEWRVARGLSHLSHPPVEQS